jgi:DNA-binding transcriptional ArsR family regulator
MPNQSLRLDPVFRALADPTRRRVIQRLARGPAATTELAGPFRMALPSFLQHLDALQAAGLVRSRKRGRVRTYEIVPKQLEAVEEFMLDLRKIWERRLDQLDDYLITLKQKEHQP